MTAKTVAPAEELRALGRLMRYARTQGYTYHITTAFGRTDWSWSKDGNYAVVAVPLSVGWSVHLDDNRVDLWPASVQQLTDVMVAVGLLPGSFRSPGVREAIGAMLADSQINGLRAERDQAQAVLAKIRELTTWEDGGEQREDIPVDEILDVLKAVA